MSAMAMAPAKTATSSRMMRSTFFAGVKHAAARNAKAIKNSATILLKLFSLGCVAARSSSFNDDLLSGVRRYEGAHGGQ